MADPTPQSDDPAAWFDDPQIVPEEVLWRFVKTRQYLVSNGDGTFGISDQAWTSIKGGCSVELKSLAELAQQSCSDRQHANDAFGTCSVTVGEVRGTKNRRDEKGKDYEDLGVAYTPIDESKPFGPNPYHCDIFPKLGKPGSKKLMKKTKLVQLDHEVAARLWEQKTGLKA